MRLRPEYALAVRDSLSACRRGMGEASPEQFARIYLAEFFDKPFSSMHHVLFDELATLHEQRGTHLAIAAPRGHAKSTVVTLAYVLWALLYDKEPYIVVVSGTGDQAQKLVDHVKRQLESNPLLLQDFPELLDRDRSPPWRKGVILLPTPGGSMLASYSAGRNLRGIRHMKHRPTLIIADDLEDKLQVIHEEQRVKLADWFNSTLLKAGTPETNVVVVGTVLHQESLLATLLDPACSPTWRTHKFAAVLQESRHPELWRRWAEVMTSKEKCGEETGPAGAEKFYRLHRRRMDSGVAVLWPEVYPYGVLMTTRLREGAAAFSAEYQNDPVDPEQCIFARAALSYWDEKYPSLSALLEAFDTWGTFYAGCDPSLANDQTRGDFTAIVVLFHPYGSNTRFVLHADIARRGPDNTIETILRYARWYPGLTVGIEANNFQQLMVKSLRDRASEHRINLSVRPIKNRVNKQARILALETEVAHGGLSFSRKHTTLMRQLLAFPLAKHDDGPDALEMAVSLTGRGTITRIWT